jgi:hypothetical protein
MAILEQKSGLAHHPLKWNTNAASERTSGLLAWNAASAPAPELYAKIMQN